MNARISRQTLLKTSEPSVQSAVPIWTPLAPAIMYSSASLPEDTPPTPTIGILTPSYISYTHLSPTGLIAGPPSPPTLFASIGIFASGEMAMPFRVLMATTASAPPLSAARARSAIDEVFGVSLAKIGTLTLFFDCLHIDSTLSGVDPISVPYPLACGQLRLSSTVSAPAAAMACARSAISSSVPPNTLPTIGTSPSFASLISSAYASIPGFGRPIAFSKPYSSSTIDGLGCPGLGSFPIDLVTIAPAPAFATSSMLLPVSSKTPEASIVGFLSFKPQMSTERWVIPLPLGLRDRLIVLLP